MKKILLPLVALMLSVTTANAQLKMVEGLKVSSTKKVVPNMGPVLQGGKIVSNTKAMAPSKKKEAFDLTDEQRFLGNSNALNPAYAVGLPGYNATKAGAMLGADILQKYAGARIIGMRFILANADAVGATHCSLVEVNGYNQNVGNFTVSDELASGELAETKAVDTETGEFNWNMVKFDTPYTIPAEPKDVIFGFNYKQKSTQNDKGYTEDCYPFYTSEVGTPGGFCVYGRLGNATGWYPLALNNSWVDLCAQVIIEQDGGFIQDIELGAISAQKFVHSKNPFALAFSCDNIGSKPITDYVFGLAFDGEEIATIAPGEALDYQASVFQVDGTALPEGTQDGAHFLQLYVKSMNGGKPTGDLSNDTLESVLRVYTDCIPHQKQLLEQFTGQACIHCPKGYDFLNILNNKRDDLAWVSIHCYQGQEGDDDYVIDEAAFVTNYSISGMPSASFNRYFYPDSRFNSGTIALPIGFSKPNDYVDIFNDIVDFSQEATPAFARVDMTQQFDVDESVLTLTVRGTGVKNAAQILAGTRLTVYLTEDGLTGTQASTGSTLYNYPHNHVLRQFVTNIEGDYIEWDGDNFEMQYVVDVDYDFDYSKMHAIAFIHNPLVLFNSDYTQYAFNPDMEDVWVSNCNSIDLSTEQTTGINTVAPAENAKVVGRYAVDGTKLQKFAKGLNIVKFSDGTSKTVVVK